MFNKYVIITPQVLIYVYHLVVSSSLFKMNYSVNIFLFHIIQSQLYFQTTGVSLYTYIFVLTVCLHNLLKMM